MARKLRVQYEGAIYHVMSRGDRREDIFHNDADRELFLKTLGEACAKTAWQVHAYCLMRNHFHLVLETPRANLVAGMKWFLSTYTARFNRRHQYFGHLFSGRYKALIVDGSGSGYLRTVCDYVHLNPARAKLLKQAHQLGDYPWSSYPAYLKPRSARPSWLRVDRVLGEAGIPKDSPAGREEFRQELLEAMEQRSSEYVAGDEIKESEEQKAERIIRGQMRTLGWTARDLATTAKGHPRKVKMAKLVRQQTTMTLKWIATRLQMGTWTHVANRIYHV